MRFSIFWVVLFFLFNGVSVVRLVADNDFQSWQWLSLHLYQKNGFKSHIYADNRMADSVSQEKLYLIGPRLHYRVSEPMSVGLGYLFLNIHDLNTDVWRKEHRVENELNFHFTLADKWTFHQRNRFEWRWQESIDQPSYRMRSRFQFRYKTNFGRLKSVYANNEFFWDIDSKDYSENRAIPLGLQFKLTTALDFNLFYMIQSLHTAKSRSWKSNHILGTHLNYRF
jgi:hypothetical protein